MKVKKRLWALFFIAAFVYIHSNRQICRSSVTQLAAFSKKGQNPALFYVPAGCVLSFDVEAFRAEFAFFQQQPDWVYLDSAATMHKPAAVIHAELAFYQRDNSNVHRGAHQLSQQATTLFEQARDQIASALNAKRREEIIWTSGATQALNILASGLMGTVLKPGDRILLTALEHHANIVPWQFYCQQHGVLIDVVPLTENHQLDVAAYQQLLELKPKVVAVAEVSNVLGTIQPLEKMINLAKAAGAITVIDGAQGVVLARPDLQALGADFYVFSGHKLYGPTGIGVLYGRYELLNLLQPLCYGGEMIQSVSFSGTTLNQLPYRLEAGTPNIAGAIGLATAMRWLNSFDNAALAAHKQQLFTELYQGCLAIKGLELLSPQQHNAGILALNIKDEHPTDVAALLNEQKIAVRAGTHCAMPLFQTLQLPGAVRLSLAAYNNSQDIKRTLQALEQSVELLQ